MVSSPGVCGLPAAQRREIKRDGDSTPTGLTQFIWKFLGENMSNIDKKTDSKGTNVNFCQKQNRILKEAALFVVSSQAFPLNCVSKLKVLPLFSAVG